ncbi:protein CNPPD1 [Coccinella septempunctata]|uniref:protein CNPPD1 n=1 Tax=Coccinella septempunctata TaxID=41139 RepID=UPI001D0816CB|nr:protein CNPPD1 [Coccinella septempunctata]
MSTFSLKWSNKNCDGIDHQKYVHRITKTLYYGKLPKTERLSLPVTELAAELFSEAQRGNSLSRLHLNTASEISRNACVSPCSLILAILYLEKLKICNPEYLQRISPSDLFLVSLMVSSKYLFDDGENDEVFMDEWAASGGIAVPELAKLEREFLSAIGWEIFVRDTMFWKKLNQIETHLAEREGKQRGFFTYTELMNLAKIIELQALIQCIVAMVAILTMTYTLGVLSVAGSFHAVKFINENSLKEVQMKTEVVKMDKICKQECLNETGKNFSHFESKNTETAQVLRASLFLASINTFVMPYCDSNCSSEENVCLDEVEHNSWEWWNIPTMKWLTENSQELFYISDINYIYKYFIRYLELLFITFHDLEIGNHINMKKSTKTRIQDQMESSWHKEWIDSLKNEASY